MERRQHTAVALAIASFEVHIKALLLYQSLRIVNIAVNKDRGAGLVVFDLVFKGDGFFRVFYAKDLLEQLPPEVLRILLLIASPGPVLNKLLNRIPLLNSIHVYTTPVNVIVLLYPDLCRRASDSAN